MSRNVIIVDCCVNHLIYFQMWIQILNFSGKWFKMFNKARTFNDQIRLKVIKEVLLKCQIILLYLFSIFFIQFNKYYPIFTIQINVCIYNNMQSRYCFNFTILTNCRVTWVTKKKWFPNRCRYCQLIFSFVFYHIESDNCANNFIVLTLHVSRGDLSKLKNQPQSIIWWLCFNSSHRR